LRIPLSKTRRTAISPVLATVILIAITLIAAIAIGGFVFGLFGSYTNTARVEAISYSCSGTPEVCTVGLQNIGTANTSLLGSCTLTFGGTIYNGVAAITSGSLNGGSTAVSTCTGPAGSHAAVGSQVVGSIVLTNAADILFSANAQ